MNFHPNSRWIPLVGLLAPLLAFEIVDSRYSNPSDWLSYDRDNTARRYSPLAQIDTANVKKLSPAWAFQFQRLPPRSEATPLVSNGVLYVTVGGEEAFALDARTGRMLWDFNYPPPADAGVQARRTNWNRGFALSGNRLFMATDDCSLLAIDARNGSLLWRVQLANPADTFGTTAAPLVVKNLVLLGVRGGDLGHIRGFIDAYDAETGKRAWRHITVPAAGEPGSETWPRYRCLEIRRRRHLDRRQLRFGFEPGLLADRQSGAEGFRRPRPQGRQSVHLRAAWP